MEGRVCVLPAAAVPSLASPLLEVFSVVSVAHARCSAHQGRAVADAVCLDFRGLTLVTCTWSLVMTIQLEPLSCPGVAIATL